MKVNFDITNTFINDSTSDRIVESGNEICTTEQTKARVAEWQSQGKFVVANGGAYDILGLNHLRGLVQAKIIGAAHMLGSTDNRDELYDLATSDEIKLVVSLDANDAIAENKSLKEHSGGAIRPILDWKTRARMLALQGIGGKGYLVDFITKHGPHSCSVCPEESCHHSSKVYNVASNGADLTIIKAINQATFDRHPDSKFHVIDENSGAFSDELLNGVISTTALVKRVRGE